MYTVVLTAFLLACPMALCASMRDTPNPDPFDSVMIVEMQPEPKAEAVGNGAKASALLMSICVPCIPRDAPHLDNLMKDLEAQTQPPHEVVIAISETSETEGTQLQAKLQEIFKKGAVLVSPTSEKMTAGENRNRAVQAATGEVISFFDADDEMHPQRTKLMLEIVGVGDNKAKCAVHSYRDDPHRSPEKKQEFVESKLDWRTANKAFGTEIYGWQKSHTKEFTEEYWFGHIPGHKCNEDGNLYACVSNERKERFLYPMQGNPTCLKDVMLNVPQTARSRGQDQEFLNNVLSKYGPNDSTMVLVDLPLTLYHPSDHEENKGHLDGTVGPKLTLQQGINSKQEKQKATLIGEDELIGGLGVKEEQVVSLKKEAPSTSS